MGHDRGMFDEVFHPARILLGFAMSAMHNLPQGSQADLERREAALCHEMCESRVLQPAADGFQPTECGIVTSFRSPGLHQTPRGMRFEDEDELVLSKIYDWYGVDFGGDETELLEHLMLYAQPG